MARSRSTSQPAEREGLEAPAANRMLDSQPWIEDPLPGCARDDEGKRHGIKVDRPDGAFDADALVEQNGKHNADRRAAEDEEILERHVLERRCPEPLILGQPRKAIVSQHAGIGEGDVERPGDEAVDKEQVCGE